MVHLYYGQPSTAVRTLAPVAFTATDWGQGRRMVHDIDLHLGKRLLLRRRQLGLTQKHLGEATGVALQQIQKYECGQCRMSAIRIWQLALALDVAVDYFFEGLNAAQVATVT
jgi:hypothetical protein